MEEVLYTGQVTVHDFPQLVADCHFAQHAFVLVERFPQQVIIGARQRKDLLRFTYFDLNIPFAEYTSGRIFDEHTELRWEKQGDTMQVVYLGPKERTQALLNYPLHAKDLLGKLKPTGGKKYFLFGERLSAEDIEKIGPAAQVGDFAEVRIPRLLHYPVQGQQPYVYLVVHEYLDEQGRVALFRFQDLKPWSPQP